MAPQQTQIQHMAVQVPMGDVTLEGDLALPADANCVVLFAHGSGSSRHSPRNRFVAQVLNEASMGTLLLDLLTVEEERLEQFTRHLRFDIDLLAERLTMATNWLNQQEETAMMNIGYFGASTGAAAALVSAAQRPSRLKAVVSRGGRPDLAGPSLPRVTAPTLLVVGGLDEQVIRLNQLALAELQCEKQMEIVSGATHLFEERGTLERVSELARGWFQEHLT